MVRLLLADDSRAARFKLRQTVEKVLPGCDVVEAADGQEGLDLAVEQKFDVALLDYNMPNLDGFELAVKLKELYPNLPIILVTANKQGAVQDRACEKGMVFIGKPISLKDFEPFEAEIRAAMQNFEVC